MTPDTSDEDQTFDDRAGRDPASYEGDQDDGAPSWMGGATAVPPGAAAALGGAGTGDNSGLLNDPRMKEMQGEYEKLQGDRRAALDPLYKQAHSMIDQPGPKPPTLEKGPKAPQQQMGQGAMEFLQVATVFGALAGLLARRGTTTSLNAFGAAIKGFSEGNAEVFKQKSQEWKQATDEVRQANQDKLDQYNMIWRDKKMNIDQKMEEIKIVASQFGDEITYNLATQRNYTALAQADEKARQFQLMYGQRADKLHMEAEAVRNKLDDHQQAKDQIEEIVEAKATGMEPPTTTGLYGKSAAVLAGLQKRGFNQAQAIQEWDAAHKQIISQNGPQQIRYFGLASDVERNIDRVNELAAQMKQSGVPLLNRANLERLAQTRGNTPQGKLATRYLTAVGDLKEPFAQLANGGYAPTIPAWEQVNKQINADYGVEQLGASLDEIKRSVQYRTNAIKAQGGLPPGSTNRYAPPAAAAAPAPASNTPKPGQGWGVPQVVE